jgi:hypothetical protein
LTWWELTSFVFWRVKKAQKGSATAVQSSHEEVRMKMTTTHSIEQRRMQIAIAFVKRLVPKEPERRLESMHTVRTRSHIRRPCCFFSEPVAFRRVTESYSQTSGESNRQSVNVARVTSHQLSYEATYSQLCCSTGALRDTPQGKALNNSKQ